MIVRIMRGLVGALLAACRGALFLAVVTLTIVTLAATVLGVFYSESRRHAQTGVRPREGR